MRSPDGSVRLSDVVQNESGTAQGFYYQVTPAGDGSGLPNGGYYCIYRKRANETAGEVPDCDGIEETLTRHAGELVGAGVSFVSVCRARGVANRSVHCAERDESFDSLNALCTNAGWTLCNRGHLPFSSCACARVCEGDPTSDTRTWRLVSV